MKALIILSLLFMCLCLRAQTIKVDTMYYFNEIVQSQSPYSTYLEVPIVILSIFTVNEFIIRNTNNKFTTKATITVMITGIITTGTILYFKQRKKKKEINIKYNSLTNKL